MSRRTWVIAACLAAALAIVLAARRMMIVLDAPPPAVVDVPVDTLPPLAPSIIEAPVTYDIATAVDSLEAAVPRTYGDLDQKIEMKGNSRLRFAYLLHRSPFRVHVAGTTVTVAADVQYSGRLWYQPPIGPEVEVSCGTGDDPPRRARLALVSTGRLTRDWGLRTRTRLLRLEAYSDSARDRCRLTFLRIDVTDRVLEQTSQMIEKKLVDFDGAVARWPVRKRFEKIWRSLHKPVRLADSVYLTFGPRAAQIGSIGANGDTAYANLRLIAEPRVVTGPRPEFVSTPLPPLERAQDVGRGARVLLDASFEYPVATAMLRKALVGRVVRQAGRRIRIRDVRLTGIGGGRVALGISVSGAVRGRLYFTGTPGFDADSRQIVVPDLEYDAGTANVLVRGYEWLNEVSLRDLLREKARLPDSAVVRRLTSLAEHGINRRLPARGTRLSGHIDHARVIAVRATLEDLRVRAVAEADLVLSIRRAPSIPRPPGTKGDAEEDDEGEAAEAVR